jgi:hemerythrin-like domain-containing protein
MSVIDILVEEHRLVRKYLDTLGIAVELIGEETKIPRAFFDDAIEFSKLFLDKYHHFKEEYVIFLKLAEKKAGTIDPQIVSLRDQHERGRNFVSQIAKSLDGYENNREVDRTALQENLGYFYLLQRQHVKRENHVFFPMARDAFSAAELDAFKTEFDKEEARLGKGTFEKCKSQVENMARILSETFPAQYAEKLKAVEQQRAHDKD